MYAIERKPSLQLAPETVFKSVFQMVKYHRDSSFGFWGDEKFAGPAVEMVRQLETPKCIS